MPLLTEAWSQPLPKNAYWIGGGILSKGAITIAAAWTKVGKSYLAMNLTRDLTDGAPHLWGNPEWPINRANVLYLDAEIGEYTMRERVKQIWGADAPQQGAFESMVPDLRLDTYKGEMKLRGLIEQYQPDVIVLDPVSGFLSPGKNESDNSDVEAFFATLIPIRRDHPSLSFVLIHHYGKPGRGDNALDPHDPYSIKGAAKWVERPHTIITIKRANKKDTLGQRGVELGFVFRSAPEMDGNVILNTENFGAKFVKVKTENRGFGGTG